MHDGQMFVFLLQVLLLLGLARGFPVDPVQDAMLDALSWFRVLFLLLETGLEIDVSAAWRQRGPALRIGLDGLAGSLKGRSS